MAIRYLCRTLARHSDVLTPREAGLADTAGLTGEHLPPFQICNPPGGVTCDHLVPSSDMAARRGVFENLICLWGVCFQMQATEAT